MALHKIVVWPSKGSSYEVHRSANEARELFFRKTSADPSMERDVGMAILYDGHGNMVACRFLLDEKVRIE